MKLGFILCFCLIVISIAQPAFAARSQDTGESGKDILSPDSISNEDTTCLLLAMSSIAEGTEPPQHCDETVKKYWERLCQEIQKQGYQCSTDPQEFWEIILKLYDKNGNGKLDPEEVIELIKKLLPWGIERGLLIDYWKRLDFSVSFDSFLRLLRLFCPYLDDPSIVPLCLNVDTFAKCKQRVVESCCEQSGGILLPPLFPGDPVTCYTGASPSMQGNSASGETYGQCFEREIQACESLL